MVLYILISYDVIVEDAIVDDDDVIVEGYGQCNDVMVEGLVTS